MERRRRGLVLAGLLVAVLVASGVVVVVVRDGNRSPGAAGMTGVTEAPAATPVAPGEGHALIAVTVATLWLEPGLARPIDAPSLGNPVDLDRWIGAMSVPDKLWLVGKLATQALYGDRVTVLETQGDWTKVAVERQPSSLDPRGYPGWLPTVQLATGPQPASPRHAVVTAPTARLMTGGAPMALSMNTTLPVASVDGRSVTVRTPAGGTGVLSTSDVDVFAGSRPAPTGAAIVRTAQLFSGLPYLWAGTSASGFDCSGFTSTVYGAHGVVIPRDADDQAGAGIPVDRSNLQPGDLLFYATDQGRGEIHHVSMYVGDGMMIQSPATGRTVETVPVDTPAYASEFWGARRYLSKPSA
jgi:cell wall-associated NlpC family hydrolase